MGTTPPRKARTSKQLSVPVVHLRRCERVDWLATRVWTGLETVEKKCKIARVGGVAVVHCEL